MQRRLLATPQRLGRPALRRSRTERGAVLVEAAIMFTFLSVVIAGVINYGTLFGATIDVSGANAYRRRSRQFDSRFRKR